MAHPPLLLEPLLKHRSWGGEALPALGKKPPPGAKPPFGESWEVADLPESVSDGRSRIKSAPYAGMTLHDAILRDREVIMGRAPLTREGCFPLLVKFLDAAESLSIQVHPDRRYADSHPGTYLKTEAWIVLEAKPGAMVYRGIKPTVDRARFERDLRAGSVVDDLITLPVRAGDCIWLPSGICHALGAGLLVAEVQTPSDTTFRVFDWGRNDPGRPLHISEAMECLLFGADQMLERPACVNADSAPAVSAGGMRTAELTRNEYFRIEQINLIGESAELEIVTNGMPVIWLILAGSAVIRARGAGAAGSALGAGSTALFPAAAEGSIASLTGGTRFLRVTLPDPSDRMLA